MSYYTDYIIECDSLAFSRMLNEWREKRGDYETELPWPEYIWENKMTDSLEKKDGQDIDRRYLLYSTINHGPSIDEVNRCLWVNLGLDGRHFLLKVKGECDDKWRSYGKMADIGGYIDLEYDEETDKMKKECIPEGWLDYEYCYIAINPKVWIPIDVDYTSESVETKNRTEETLEEIVERLDYIVDLLSELYNRIAKRK